MECMNDLLALNDREKVTVEDRLVEVISHLRSRIRSEDNVRWEFSCEKPDMWLVRGLLGKLRHSYPTVRYERGCGGGKASLYFPLNV